MASPSQLRSRLQAALADAMKARDRETVSVLRSTLAAVENAEAVGPLDPAAADSEVVAGAVVGLGAAEAVRRTLGEDEVAAVVAAEISELLDAAETYELAGRQDRADPLRAGAAVLAAVAQTDDLRTGDTETR